MNLLYTYWDKLTEKFGRLPFTISFQTVWNTLFWVVREEEEEEEEKKNRTFFVFCLFKPTISFKFIQS